MSDYAYEKEKMMSDWSSGGAMQERSASITIGATGRPPTIQERIAMSVKQASDRREGHFVLTHSSRKLRRLANHRVAPTRTRL